MSRENEVLINELEHNANASGNRPAERRLCDLTVWFYHNRHRIAPENLKSRVDFLEKALWIQLEQNALLLDRLHELETATKSKKLFLPIGLTASGDVKRFG